MIRVTRSRVFSYDLLQLQHKWQMSHRSEEICLGKFFKMSAKLQAGFAIRQVKTKPSNLLVLGFCFSTAFLLIPDQGFRLCVPGSAGFWASRPRNPQSGGWRGMGSSEASEW